MISTLYIEDEVAEHPIARAIRRRFHDTEQIPIERYGEVFNRKAQNFRLQKKRPALILARKFEGHVLPAPPSYGLGTAHNYYFSHMLNCVYDCRYCFLQGMYRSAHYVLFVNYEDFQSAIESKLNESDGDGDGDTFFYSGYDCDSLALEPVSGFAGAFLPFFARHPRAHLELRTKSTQIRTLLKHDALANVVTAFSFTPAPVATALEHKVPNIERRIDAMAKLQEHGWLLGLRFDPLIYSLDYHALYRALFATIFERIAAARLHSVSLGPFRLPKSFYRTMRQLYPDEPLLASAFAERNGVVSYPHAVESEMREFCTRELRRYIPDDILFPCDF